MSPVTKASRAVAALAALLTAACTGAQPGSSAGRPRPAQVASPDQYAAAQATGTGPTGAATPAGTPAHPAATPTTLPTGTSSPRAGGGGVQPDANGQSASPSPLVARQAVNTRCRQPAATRGGGLAAKGQRPPDFTATTVDCKTLTFSQFTHGRPTLVTFFASWCEGCQAEAKDLQAVYREWHDRNGFVIVGVDTKDEDGSPARFYDHFGWTFASVWDDQEHVFDAWFASAGSSALPLAFWIKPDGSVNDIVIGAESRSQMEQEMSQL